MRSFFRSLIRFYRLFLSPFLGGQCRFTPSCSTYALEAIEGLPLGRALVCIFKRLTSCHPFHPGGLDPVMRMNQPRVNGGGSPSGVNDELVIYQMGGSGGERYHPPLP